METPKRLEPTGISVLIVGAGVAGLMAALDCWRQGHDVRIIERAPSRLLSGDGFTIGGSAAQALRYWPQMVKENAEIASHPWLSYHKITGERISGPTPLFTPEKGNAAGGDAPPEVYRHSRPKFHKMLSDQLQRHGIQVEYGHHATQYYENTESKTAGVVLATGDKVEADVVVAADGIGSRSSMVTMGHYVKAIPSGNSVYRAAFPLELALRDAEVRERFKAMDDGTQVAEMWMGEGVHAFFHRSDDEMTWVINYVDEDAGEKTDSWSRIVGPETVLETTSKIKGWPEVADRLIKLTPRDRIHDFRLMWREPQPCWTSRSGRVVQIGDAAHTFLPSSGNGATQGMEDAVSLATCLRVAGREGIPWATKVHTKLRFERVSCLQMLGILNHVLREHADKTKKVEPIGLTGRWIWQHDPEQYAIDKFDAAKAHLLEGADVPFANTNIPRGYEYEPWTIDQVLSRARAGEVRLEGGWE